MPTHASKPRALTLLSAALLLVLCGSPARAANLIVNTLSDTVAADGLCTLREAITNANSDSDTTGGDCPESGSYGADTITFNVSGTLPLGDRLFITDADELTLDGSGQSVTVSGENLGRAMQLGVGAALTVRYLTVANGRPSTNGAGILNNNGTLTVTNSTFSGNSADNGLGGGISNGGTLTVTNSTFSGNSANEGGGIYNSYGTLTVSNSTFSGNSASETGGGGIFNFNGTLHLANSILANSTGGDCFNDGALNATGVNLVEDGSCGATISGDPNLGPLADNGGPTLTHALLTMPTLSPAIDAADNALCASAPVNNLDQRGESRPQDGDDDGTAQCDIGAYELQLLFLFAGFFPPVDNPPTVNTVKAGRGIPVKFSLGGDRGLDIFPAGYPGSALIGCSDGAPLDPIEATVSAGASGLSYDPATDTYTYVWKTQKAWAGQCRKLTVRLTDGSDHMALFQFK